MLVGVAVVTKKQVDKLLQLAITRQIKAPVEVLDSSETGSLFEKLRSHRITGGIETDLRIPCHLEAPVPVVKPWKHHTIGNFTGMIYADENTNFRHNNRSIARSDQRPHFS